jgi:hypothetical protein
MKIPLNVFLVALALATALKPRAAAQPAPVLTWVPGSSMKLEQIIGDCDWDVFWHSNTCLPTTSATSNRFGVLGDGQLSSFESNGKLIVIGGDAISGDPTNHNLHAWDPIGYSTTIDPEAGFLINYYTNADGSTVFVKTTGTNMIQMGGDDLPTSGITLPDGTYLFVHTGETNKSDDYVYSLLVRFDEPVLTNFTLGRSISSNLYNGHFVHGVFHADGTNVCLFGTGRYRASPLYLSIVSASNFVAGTGTRYYAGWTNGQPQWGSHETNAAPVLTNVASVGDFSVAYSANLGLWLMTYDAGWNDTNIANGIYFTYAAEPWGPWATPQLIFHKKRDDNALGRYIHKAISIANCAAGDGLNGPIINEEDNNPCPVDGEAFAPGLIERFITISNNTLLLYYTMGTFNPYTVVKMRSEFIIAPVIDPGSLVHKKNKFSFSWAAPTNESYQVDYSTNLSSGWTTLTDIISSITGTFNFTNTQPGGLPGQGFYRLRSRP